MSPAKAPKSAPDSSDSALGVALPGEGEAAAPLFRNLYGRRKGRPLRAAQKARMSEDLPRLSLPGFAPGARCGGRPGFSGCRGKRRCATGPPPFWQRCRP